MHVDGEGRVDDLNSRYVSSGFCGISSGGKKIAWH